MRSILVLVSVFGLAGCTGHVVMSPYSGGPGDIDGVLVTRSIQAVEVDEYTQIAIPGVKSSSGSPSMPAPQITSGECSHVQVRKLVTIPDQAHLYRLHYVPGLLEAHSFGMTMDSSGVLTSINSQSTPDAGKTLSSLTGVAVSAQKMALGAGTPGNPALPPCTTGASLIGFESAQPLMNTLQ